MMTLGLNGVAQSVTHRLLCFLKPCAKMHLKLLLYMAVICRLTWVSMACVCALKLMVKGTSVLAPLSRSRAPDKITLLPTPVVPVNKTAFCTLRHACKCNVFVSYFLFLTMHLFADLSSGRFCCFLVIWQHK